MLFESGGEGWLRVNTGEIWTYSRSLVHGRFRGVNLRTIRLSAKGSELQHLMPTRNNIVAGAPPLYCRHVQRIPGGAALSYRQGKPLLDLRFNEQWVVCALQSRWTPDRAAMILNGVDPQTHFMVRDEEDMETVRAHCLLYWAHRKEKKHRVNVGWRISLWWMERGTVIERAYCVGSVGRGGEDSSCPSIF